MNEKIVVTGVNVISSLGLNIEENWNNLINGKSGIKKIDLFDPEICDTKIAGQVSPDFDNLAAQYLKKRQRKQMTRATQFCLTAVKDLIAKQEIDFSAYVPSRGAVILGVVHTANTSVEKGTKANNFILKGMNNAIPAWISMEYSLQGPCYAVSTACASSAYAIANAYDLIKNDQADFVIVGGVDSTINPEEIKGFNAMHALSTNNDNPEKASCPFSADRDGFVIGEGAGILILEKESKAKERNANILAELAGHALTNEAFNIMAPKTDGEGMMKTMQKALENSGVSPEEIDYINAHGTSTMLNDLYETKAIKKLFDKRAGDIPVNSSKSMLGHTIGAAGAIESAITVKSISENLLHPTINLVNPDPELDLDYVSEGNRGKKIRAAISNSFGFGGHNSSLVFKPYRYI